jgi:hypothetical protein
MQSRAHLGRKLDRAGITQNLDGFLGLIHDHSAVFTVLKVAFQLGLQTRIEIAIKIVGEFVDDAFAIQ